MKDLLEYKTKALVTEPEEVWESLYKNLYEAFKSKYQVEDSFLDNFKYSSPPSKGVVDNYSFEPDFIEQFIYYALVPEDNLSLWRSIIKVKKKEISTPYSDYTEWNLKVLNKRDAVSNLSGIKVYDNIETVDRFMKDDVTYSRLKEISRDFFPVCTI